MDNFIDWVRQSLDEPWQPHNFQRNRTRGLTFSGNYRLFPGQRATSWMVGLGYTWLSPEFDDSHNAGFLSKYVIESLRHQIAANIHVSSGRFSARSEEHTSELQSLMRISYAVF